MEQQIHRKGKRAALLLTAAAIMLCSCAEDTSAENSGSGEPQVSGTTVSAAAVIEKQPQAASDSSEKPSDTTAVTTSEAKTSAVTEAPSSETTTAASSESTPDSQPQKEDKPRRTVEVFNTASANRGEKTYVAEGLSYMDFYDDYSFDKFLENGGAKSELGIVSFLGRNLIENVYGISPAKRFGCSAFQAKGADGMYFGRNFDWIFSNALVVVAHPENGYSSISTANTDFLGISGLLDDKSLAIAALYCPLDGMNEKGLCISVNMVSDDNVTSQDTDKPDLTTTTAVRLLLDRASDVDSAIALLKQYDMHLIEGLMIHFMLSDSSGRSVCIEYSGGEMMVTETPVMTNHYLCRQEKEEDKMEQSYQRFDIITEALDKYNGSFTQDMAMDVLESVSQEYFESRYNLVTEWSAVYDCAKGEVLYCLGGDFTKSYRFSFPMS